MATKSSQPALYEKMRSRMGASVNLPARVESAAPARLEANDDSFWKLLSPGRTVRLPVGYLLLFGGITIFLVVVSYTIGHRSGHAAGEAEFQKNFLANAGRPGDASLQALDPLLETSGSSSVASKTAAPPRGASTPQRQNPAGSRALTNPSGWGPIESTPDPRRKGISYLVLSETNPSGAVRLADFCRANGLETYVVSGKNAKTRRVLVFPGFDLRVVSRTSSDVTAVEERVHQVGDRWKKEKKGDSNLRDAYWLEYQ